VDDPGIDGVVAHASDLSFARDPFDRLIAGHALLRRFRLATADALLLHHLPERATLEL
jgi:PIN domain nuclease of toxin-antitoxin system